MKEKGGSRSHGESAGAEMCGDCWILVSGRYHEFTGPAGTFTSEVQSQRCWQVCSPRVGQHCHLETRDVGI